ncbi:MAG: hypothetical protein KF712_00185 [Akkermansiaceae bacterium]|nr:hypothetical protein [Akkermansiaceae bacterium]
MALSKNIPLKNLVFTEKSLKDLIESLSEGFDPSAKDGLRQRYSLHISEDSDTAVFVDEPPKHLGKMLENSIENISLRFDRGKPTREIELKLNNGNSSHWNYIKISGHDEDWVQLTHAKINKLLSNHKSNSGLYWRFHWVVSVVLIVLCVFLFVRLGRFMAGKILDEQYLKVYSVLESFVGLVGVFVGFALLLYMNLAYPVMEIQTGPVNGWRAMNRRKRVKPILWFLFVAPFLTYLGDLWKMIIIGK